MELPKIKVWSGTVAHMSLDTRLHKRLVDLLKLEGFNADYRGDWSIETLAKDKQAIVTHHARSAYKYRLTPSQTDAEEIMLDQQVGKLPQEVKMFVTAHNHTTEGSTEIGTIKVVRCPCFTTFIPYTGSLRLLPHYQPDIGAWFIIVTKEGRIRTQEWLYPSFMYHLEDDLILYGAKNLTKSYADPQNYELEDHLKVLLQDAQLIIMVVADLHVGEPYSVCPPSMKYSDETKPLMTTKANDLLFAYWKHLIEIAKKIGIDEVWLVGDAFSGGQIFEKTRESVAILEYQPYMVLELFKLLKNP